MARARESFSLLHEVAVGKVEPSQAVWQQGAALAVNVTLANHGGFDENVTVTVYANGTVVASYSLVSMVGNLTSVMLPYTGQALNPGTYTLKATVSQVSGKTYTADNTVAGGTITVTEVVPEFPPALLLAALMIATLRTRFAEELIRAIASLCLLFSLSYMQLSLLLVLP